MKFLNLKIDSEVIRLLSNFEPVYTFVQFSKKKYKAQCSERFFVFKVIATLTAAVAF